MAKAVDKLSARRAASETKPGRHGDGGGLYLNVTATGAKSWVFIWKQHGRRREMGLGSLSDVTLAEAREKATKARRQAHSGLDPITERDRSSAIGITFGKAADDLIASMEPNWRSAKHRAQWKMTLLEYCKSLRSKPVSAIETADVLAVLQPIWGKKPETASRIRGRIERVLDYARALGEREGENPARWRGHLSSILPHRAKLTRGHHRALPILETPAFMSRLRGSEGVGARALEFTILTAARSNEVLGLVWTELDPDRTLWTVPRERMKGGREHRVPLSGRATEILLQMESTRVGNFVFPGMRRGKSLSSGALEAVLTRMQIEATPHGFRSTFRDWVGEHTSFSTELAEIALAHRVGDKTEQAYRRGDALDRRRELMEAWASFTNTTATGQKIVPIRG